MTLTGAQSPNGRPARPRRRLALLAVAWLAALTLFAIWTRGPMLREGLWRDEAISVSIANAPSLSELLARNRVADYNPPLFNMVLACYTRLAGSGEMSLKLFALTLGLLAVGAAAALGWELGGPIASALAAAFAVNNPILIDMSTELRAYSLSALLTAVSLIAVFRVRRRGLAARPTGFVVLTASLTLLVYSHLAGGVVAAVLFCWGLLEWRRDPADAFGKRLAASALIAVAAFLFWLPTAWRQFHTGIPWDESLSVSSNFASLLHRSRDVVPIPQGFRQPFLFAGLGMLAILVVTEAPRVAFGLRRSRERLIVPAVAGLAVWLALGLFSRQPRYLIIPAALFAVGLALLVAIVFEASREARPFWRGAAWVGALALGLSAFASRADFYRQRFAARPLSKSGIRELCQAHPVAPGELVVAAPDYLAPTIWYYCGGGEGLRGFARWENPVHFDPTGYAALWRDPLAVNRTIARVENELRKAGRSRFELIFDETAVEPPLHYGIRVGDLRRRLSSHYGMSPVGRFSGRLESVEAEMCILREEK